LVIMDSVISHIASRSGNQSDLKQLRSYLMKHQQHIQSAGSQLDSALGMIDAKKQSLGFTYLLYCKSRGNIKDNSLFLRQVELLFTDGDRAQIAMVAPEFVEIAHTVQRRAHKSQRYLGSLKLLLKGVRKLQPASSYLTPLHVYLLQNAILARCYHVVEAVLDETPTDIDPDVTHFSITHFLQYCYYGAIAYIGLKRFNAALQLLQLAITAPAMALSAIVYECHKKFILCSLIQDGKVRQVPKHASQMVTRTLKMLTHPAYNELVTAYSTNSTDELHKVAEKHVAEFQSDNNFGLVKQVIQSLYSRNILRTTKVYLTLSLSDIKESAALTSEAEVESRILSMIEDGALSATIDQAQATVSFNADAESFNTVEMVHKLEGHLRRAHALNEKATALDEGIISSTAYLRRKVLDGEPRGWAGDFDEGNDLPGAVQEGALMR